MLYDTLVETVDDDVEVEVEVKVESTVGFFLEVGYPHHRMVFGRALVRGPLERGRTPTRMPPV